MTTELPGRVAAFLTADVRPQVNCIILKRLFRRRRRRQGRPAALSIAPEPYQPAYGSAVAAEAAARAHAERHRRLVSANPVSKQDYDDAEASYFQTQAAVKTARINLIYKVLSPTSGRFGRSFVTEGGLVTAKEATRTCLGSRRFNAKEMDAQQ
jgi:membrane fusion protein (multidrug efflux system)